MASATTRKRLEEWWNRPIAGEHPYVFLDLPAAGRSGSGGQRALKVSIQVPIPARGIAQLLRMGWSRIDFRSGRGIGGSVQANRHEN
jgi:hypothetical protein